MSLGQIQVGEPIEYIKSCGWYVGRAANEQRRSSADWCAPPIDRQSTHTVVLLPSQFHLAA